ncbi:hypothetical protein [Bdellovibrio bacteriovorus]|nr:hypothetical protein [Bdellovibrio bacteriovorus]BFD67185.1 hypothetical protein HAGR004_22070 [Bdellovibrio sp. HAGR004]
MFKKIKLKVVGMIIAIALAAAAGYLGVSEQDLRDAALGTAPIEAE